MKNMRTLTAATLAATLLLGAAAPDILAQDGGGTPAPSGPVDNTNNPAFWQGRFANGGHYMVRLNNIVSVSKHEYIANAAARVVEVTIATNTSVVARFYWLEAVGKDTPLAAGAILMNRAEELAKQGASRVSESAGKIQVVKDYPNTTHAHTVEFALQNEADLNALHLSLLGCMHRGRGLIWNEGG